MEVVFRFGYYPHRFMNPHENKAQNFPGSLRKPKLLRSQSIDLWKRKIRMILGLRRVSSAWFDHSSSDEAFEKNVEEWDLQIAVKPLSIDVGRNVFDRRSREHPAKRLNDIGLARSLKEVNGSTNDIGLPLTLKILKKKKGKDRVDRYAEGAKQFECCSTKKAVSSMIHMIRELQAYNLLMREVVLCEDLQEILGKVQAEMQASFVWLFQQVFLSSPTLMVSVMILLANFAVYSMGNKHALAAIPFVGSATSAISLMKVMANKENKSTGVDPLDKTLLPIDNVEKSNLLTLGDELRVGFHESISNVSQADGDSTYEGFSQNHVMFLENSSGKALSCSFALANEVTGRILGGELMEAEEEKVKASDQIATNVQLWGSFLMEFQSASNVSNAHVDLGTIENLVVPFSTQIEPDNYICYDKTELLYQNAISTDPDNDLILSNYAQFLYLVRHENDRAEGYLTESTDGETIIRFANFLWLARGDLFTADKIYTDAINVEPKNPFHAASYAYFLWHTDRADFSCPNNPTI